MDSETYTTPSAASEGTSDQEDQRQLLCSFHSISLNQNSRMLSFRYVTHYSSKYRFYE